MWYGSVSSIPSSNGSISYTSPQSVSQNSTIYQHSQSSPPPVSNSAPYGPPPVYQQSQSSPPPVQNPAAYVPPPAYQHSQTSPPPIQNSAAYGPPPPRQQVSPQPAPPIQNMYPHPQQPNQQSHMYSQMPPPQQYRQPLQQFSFNEPVYHSKPAASMQPNQQFAAWSGYTGPTVTNTYDEENAVPPKSVQWDLTHKTG